MPKWVRAIGLAISNKTYLPTWIALFVVVFALVFAEKQNQTIHHQSMRAEVQNEAGLVRSRLEGYLNADIQLVKGLVAVIATTPDIDQARFSDLAAHAVGDRAQILNIAAAPDLVVTMVYPYEVNKSVIGLDYNRNEAQRAATLRVRDTGEIVLAGPVNLVQGGIGFIVRYPIFVGEGEARRFWGIVSAVIDATSLYEETGVTGGDMSLEIALTGQDGTGGRGDLFFGQSEIYDQNPILMDIVLPTGSWQLAAIPKGGWPRMPDNIWVIRLVLLAAGTLILVPTFLACRMSAVRRGAIKILRRREHELQRKQAELLQLSMVAQNASDSIILTDPDGRIIWANAAFSKMTGYSIDEAIGKTPGGLLNGPDTNEKTIDEIAQHVAAGKRHRNEILNYTKSGDKIWVDTHLVPVHDDTGAVQMVIGIERDVTLSKKSAAELAEAKLAAEQADRAKSEFLANMSHEIRTPMNGIMGMSDLLADCDLSDEEQQYVEIIRTSSKALLKIINDILDLSRLESGKLALSEVDFELEACIDGAVDVLRPIAAEKGLSLSVTYAGDLPRKVRADDGRLRQVLVNLVGNAVKFTSSGRVDVRVMHAAGDPHKLVIDVEDTGIGLSEAQLDNVFERFSQADAATTRAFGGTGLGLTISRHLAAQMGGDIFVRSEIGRGSCFTLHVQTHRAHGDRKEDEAVPTADVARLRGTVVLLAEDNRTNRLLIRKYLSDLAVELIEVENGSQAVEVCAQRRLDLVLMDMSMPVMDGLSATKEIRNLAIVQPPILALTANAFASDRDACLEAGMNGFLSKPINKRRLWQSMSAALAEAEPYSGAASA